MLQSPTHKRYNDTPNISHWLYFSFSRGTVLLSSIQNLCDTAHLEGGTLGETTTAPCKSLIVNCGCLLLQLTKNVLDYLVKTCVSIDQGKSPLPLASFEQGY
uniref:Uncharacterized protein n=1 Tax=Amphimedon queenslandica TaxID=400682 RepID=A0A1X7TVE7_AMPQE